MYSKTGLSVLFAREKALGRSTQALGHQAPEHLDTYSLVGFFGTMPFLDRVHDL
jgi:hypothetical protein